MPDAGGQSFGLGVEECKKELKEVSKRVWEWETIWGGEAIRGKEREAIQKGGKKLKQKQGSSETEI